MAYKTTFQVDYIAKGNRVVYDLKVSIVLNIFLIMCFVFRSYHI